MEKTNKRSLDTILEKLKPRSRPRGTAAFAHRRSISDPPPPCSRISPHGSDTIETHRSIAAVCEGQLFLLRDQVQMSYRRVFPDGTE